ncbi:hypothetical protein QFZ96_002410 [Paraburkholderia youngii]
MVEPLFVQCQFQQLALGEPVFKRAPMLVERQLLPGAIK